MSRRQAGQHRDRDLLLARPAGGGTWPLKPRTNRCLGVAPFGTITDAGAIEGGLALQAAVHPALGWLMIEIVLAHSDLARVRFAHSPVEELVASLRVLRDPGRRPMYGRWLSAVRPRLGGGNRPHLR